MDLSPLRLPYLPLPGPRSSKLLDTRKIPSQKENSIPMIKTLMTSVGEALDVKIVLSKKNCPIIGQKQETNFPIFQRQSYVPIKSLALYLFPAFFFQSPLLLLSASWSLLSKAGCSSGGGRSPDYDVHLHNKLMPASSAGKENQPPSLLLLLRRRRLRLAAGQHKLNNKVQLSRHGRPNFWSSL